MRLRATAAVAVVAISIAAAALADKTTVKLEKPAPVLVQSRTWTTLLQLSRRGRRLDGFRPVLEIEDEYGHRSYLGAETAPGVYRVRVVFPRRGPWKYRIRVGGETVKTGAMWVLPQ
jgi:hypothetical protein